MGLKRMRHFSHLEPNLKDRVRYLIFQKDKYPDEIILATELQSLYPEYKRKKLAVLKNQIKQCLDQISEEDTDFESNFKTKNKDKILKSECYIAEEKTCDIFKNSITEIYKRSNQSMELDSPAKKDVESMIICETNQNFEIKEKSTTTPKQQKNLEKLLDFGGIDHQIIELKQYISHFHVKTNILSKNKGLLIHGPPGVGKSSLVEAVANYLKINLLRTILYCSNNTEHVLNEIFEFARKMQPCIIFLDKIDSIGMKNESSSFEKDRTLITQLQKLFDTLPNFDVIRIFVIGSATRYEKLDNEILNLFDNNLKIDLPNQKARQSILEIICNSNSKIRKSKIDIENLSKITPGFVAKDYYKLFSNANNIAIFELINYDFENSEIKNFEIEKLEFKHIENALKKFNPISKTEGFAEITNVSWNDIGALKEAKDLLEFCILDRVKLSGLAKDLGLENPEGILMYGPPGCGKTLLAKAIANEAEINFISVKGPELMNKYVGESERAVRELFLRANKLKPCIIFFDEFDSIACCQSESNNDVSTRVMKQLLVEMDGYNPRHCFLLAATNRPDLIDPAILRPGRFDCSIYIGFPNAEERVDILNTITKNGSFPKCASNVDFEKIGLNEVTNGYTGADLARLIKVASGLAFKELALKAKKGSNDNLVPYVTEKHFFDALIKTRPTLGEKQRRKFEEMKIKIESLSK